MFGVRAILLSKSQFADKAAAEKWATDRHYVSTAVHAQGSDWMVVQAEGAGPTKKILLEEGVSLIVGECAPGATMSVASECFECRPSVERDSKKGRLARMTWEFQCLDTVGKNRRIYPEELFKTSATLLNSEAARGRVYGRLDHPSEWDPKQHYVTLSDAAIKLVSIEVVKPKTVRVVADVADNEHGRQLISLLEVEGDVSISQRALVLWGTPTKEEEVAYGLEEGQVIDIARALRLITYDAVGQPGFDSAGTPTVTESEHMTAKEMLAKFRTDNPEAAALIKSEIDGAVKTALEAEKASMATAIATAVEAAKPTIATEATKTLQADLAAAQKKVADLTKVVDTLQPALSQLTGKAETEATKAATLATEKAEKLEKDLKAANEALATAQTELKAIKDKHEILHAAAEAAKIAAKVRETYKDHKFKNQILASIEGIATEAEALQAAARKAAEIDAVYAAIREEFGGGDEAAKPGAVDPEGKKKAEGDPGLKAVANALAGPFLIDAA